MNVMNILIKSNDDNCLCILYCKSLITWIGVLILYNNLNNHPMFHHKTVNTKMKQLQTFKENFEV